MSACSLELFDLTGNSCGTLEFATEGRGCRSIELGLDGTVFTQPVLR